MVHQSEYLTEKRAYDLVGHGSSLRSVKATLKFLREFSMLIWLANHNRGICIRCYGVLLRSAWYSPKYRQAIKFHNTYGNPKIFTGIFDANLISQSESRNLYTLILNLDLNTQALQQPIYALEKRKYHVIFSRQQFRGREMKN